MKCPQCNKVQLQGRQKYCSPACKQKAHRVKNSIETSDLERAIEVLQQPKDLPKPHTHEKESRHARRCISTEEGAVWRGFKSGKGEWVIPGAHYVGKGEDRVWTSCLNPDCATV